MTRFALPSLSRVVDIAHTLAGERDRERLFPLILQTVGSVIPADIVLLTIRSDAALKSLAMYSEPAIEIESNQVDDYYRANTVYVGGTANLTNESDLADYPLHKRLWARYGIRTSLLMPLFVEQKAVGALACWSREPHFYDEVDLAVASEVGTTVAVSVDRCLAYEHIVQLHEEAAHERAYLRDALASELRHEGMIGESAAFTVVRKQLEAVADTDATVLLTGESGTGKDVIARALHDASARRKRRLVTVNCAAIPANLAESELFGHEEGAFTGAGKARPGRFEQADGGTLFLDEVGELPLDVQAKLLRVVQERELERVGGGEPIKIDVRIIAATNRDLGELIAAGRFREDLFFRLSVFPIHLPPLRARLDDLAALVDNFVKLAAERFRVAPRVVTPEVIRRLSDHDWPGNIRELQHAIERAMIVSQGESLDVDAVLPRRIAPSIMEAATPLRAEYMATLESAGWVIEGKLAARRPAWASIRTRSVIA